MGMLAVYRILMISDYPCFDIFTLNASAFVFNVSAVP